MREAPHRIQTQIPPGGGTAAPRLARVSALGAARLTAAGRCRRIGRTGGPAAGVPARPGHGYPLANPRRIRRAPTVGFIYSLSARPKMTSILISFATENVARFSLAFWQNVSGAGMLAGRPAQKAVAVAAARPCRAQWQLTPQACGLLGCARNLRRV
ncbi:MAG: hypothetical protein JNJ60_12140 [Rhodocyclaceae bacterium]|nr:hypothetical protein [Rhodocyclaceae bacterium]